MLTIATKNITITLRKDSFIRLEVIMVGLTLDEKVEMNISYFDYFLNHRLPYIKEPING